MRFLFEYNPIIRGIRNHVALHWYLAIPVRILAIPK